MAHLKERLAKFEQERKDIHDKMKPLKKELKPLSKRLEQVNVNIAYLKFTMRKEKIQ